MVISSREHIIISEIKAISVMKKPGLRLKKLYNELFIGDLQQGTVRFVELLESSYYIGYVQKRLIIKSIERILDNMLLEAVKHGKLKTTANIKNALIVIDEYKKEIS